MTENRLANSRRAVVRRPLIVGVFIVAAIGLGVLAAMVLRSLTPVADFIETYPGTTSLAADQGALVEGFPAWVTWQHFLNFFLLAMIIRTGIASRVEARPIGYWSPRGNKKSDRVRLIVFTHLSLDILWMLNGVIYVALLFISGRWARLIPTSWDFIPSSLSVAIQYASLNWPTESSWAHYNSLQQVTYFLVVFILAPASIATGWRLSPLWPKRWERFVSLEKARALHFPLMVAFLVFVVGHVLLVMLTGALRNLNHMFAGLDSGESWSGVVLFAILALVTAACTWAVSRPFVITTWGALTGSVTR